VEAGKIDYTIFFGWQVVSEGRWRARMPIMLIALPEPWTSTYRWQVDYESEALKSSPPYPRIYASLVISVKASVQLVQQFP